MVRMYCRDHHAGGTEAGAAHASGAAGLCPSCSALLDYSLARVAECRFGGEKPPCGRCSVHCFRPLMREQIRTVMRYSGPRMIRRHPCLAIKHLLDRRRPVPAVPRS
jgi:hypothetical protein